MNSNARSFEIRSAGESVQIAADDVYFTFGDGRLTYDCIQCGSKCCRGHGYSFGGRAEVLYQLTSQPYTRFFIDAVPDDTVAGMRNFPPACFFLDENGLCSVHVDHGYDAKPETCRFFPFNAFHRLGRFLIVSPHSGLCPLAIVRPGKRDPRSEHHRLLAALSAAGVRTEVPACRAMIHDTDCLIGLERRILEVCEVKADGAGGAFEEFVDSQVNITYSVLALARDPAHGEWERASAPDASALTRCAEQLLGTKLTEEFSADSTIDRTIAVLTPYLRSRFVFAPEGGNRRESQAMQIALHRVPAMILGVRHIARLAALAGMKSVTFQTITQLLSSHGALVWCLAHGADVMVWRRGAFELPPPRLHGFLNGYIRVMRDLLPARQRKHSRALADILCEHNVWDGPERIAFLNFIGGRIARLLDIQDYTHANAHVADRIRFRAGLQRSAMAILPDEVLEEIWRRVADRVTRTRG